MSNIGLRSWPTAVAVVTSCVLAASQLRAQQTTSGTTPDTAAGKAVGLPGVTVTGKSTVDPRMIGFEAHRAKGFGNFLTREQLDNDHGRKFSDVLRQLSGAVQIQRGPDGRSMYLANREQQGHATLAHPDHQCFVQIIVDGTRVYGPDQLGGAPPDVNDVRPESLEGVEFYSSPSSTPVEYRNGQSECGTLVLWTRTK